MNLPIPTARETAEFALIYERKYGVRLTEEDARDAATRVLQLFYLGTYGLLGIEGDKAAGQPHDARSNLGKE